MGIRLGRIGPLFRIARCIIVFESLSSLNFNLEDMTVPRLERGNLLHLRGNLLGLPMDRIRLPNIFDFITGPSFKWNFGRQM
jgi:hypothetical protein